MRPGTLRYHRSLGFVGDSGKDGIGASVSSSHWWERVMGIDASGTPVAVGGKGVMISAAPSSILAGMIGSGLGVSMSKNKVGGAILGFFLGMGAATAFRWSADAGI